MNGMGYPPFFLEHGREAVLPGQLVAESSRRLPVETGLFVEKLHERLATAFHAVIRNDVDGMEHQILESTCLPDQRFEVGDRSLHYRMPTDAEESLKITERWQHAVVDEAGHHPRCLVRDGEGRQHRENVRFLIPGNLLGRAKQEPAASAGATSGVFEGGGGRSPPGDGEHGYLGVGGSGRAVEVGDGDEESSSLSVWASQGAACIAIGSAGTSPPSPTGGAGTAAATRIAARSALRAKVAAIARPREVELVAYARSRRRLRVHRRSGAWHSRCRDHGRRRPRRRRLVVE